MAWSAGTPTPFDVSTFASDLTGGRRVTPGRKLQFLGDIYSQQGQGILGAGGKLLERGVETLDQPLAYFRGLLGSRQEALGAAAPDVETARQLEQTAAKAVSDFGGRGGGPLALKEEGPYRLAAGIQGLIQRERPMAAEAIASIAQLLGSWGISQEQVGMAEGSLGAQILESLYGGEITKRGQTMAFWGEIISSLLGGVGKGMGQKIGGTPG